MFKWMGCCSCRQNSLGEQLHTAGWAAWLRLKRQSTAVHHSASPKFSRSRASPRACQVQWTNYPPVSHSLKVRFTLARAVWNTAAPSSGQMRPLHRKHSRRCPERAPVLRWTRRWVIPRQEPATARSDCSPAFVALHHTPSTWSGRGGSYPALIQEFPLSPRAVARSWVSTLQQTFDFNWVSLFPLAAENSIDWWLFFRGSSQMFRFKVQQRVLQKGRLLFLCKFETEGQRIYLYD